MNRILSLTSFCLALGLGTAAHALVSFGVKAGGSYSKHSVNGVSGSGDSKFGVGYQAGGSLQAGALGFGALVDVLYAQRAYGSSADLYKWKEDSLLVPVQVRYAVIPLVSVTAGGYVAMGLGDSFSADDPARAASYTGSTPDVKKLDYGAVFGLQFTLPLGAMTLTVEPRYYWGFVNRLDSSSAELKMNSADLLVGLEF